MTDKLANLEAAVESLLARHSLPTQERIRQLIDGLRIADDLLGATDEEAEMLARRLEARHGVSMSIGAVLIETGWRPWLDAIKPNLDTYYWGRYRRLLGQKHLSGHVISAMDDVTDRILGLLENPLREGRWDRRGLVVGHVQSGKTANYVGLICKAADAGYRVVVILAGLHNNLRNQTQLRVDEGFVGRDSARLLSKHDGDLLVGVGRFDSARRPTTFTTTHRDFDRMMATGVGVPLQNLTEPAVFVIKKNPNTLRNLTEWLREHSANLGSSTIDAPMLLIDDEADNASINIKHRKGQVACINGLIRQLLTVFAKSCYVGYTATPFANIFIDPDTDDEMLRDDLFPRSFIVSLDPPSNYFGPERVFFEDSAAVLREINDNEDLLPLQHRKDHQVVGLPPSLMSALRTFVVARTIRICRGHAAAHCSMLVNASRFISVQRQLRNELHERLDYIRDSIRVNAALAQEEALRDSEMRSLYETWRSEYSDAGVEWSSVQAHLLEAIAPIKVVEVNSSSSGKLDYAGNGESGLNVIAVGGLALSRGLTLEGLVVSYFLRNSMMYDTLMQMGRWFGYRPEYEDLCRVWMLEEAAGWYEHITDSIEMLRGELRAMEGSGATPVEFGLKVRAHPDTLVVTAREKMGSGERLTVRIGLANSFIETATLRAEPEALAMNVEAARRFGKQLASLGHDPKSAEKCAAGYLLRRVPVDPVISFLGSFQNHPLSMLTESEPVLHYIKDRQQEELALWDVLFTSVQDREGYIRDSSLGIDIYCQKRSAGTKSDARTIRITNKQRVASRGIERFGLAQDEIQRAESEFAAGQQSVGSRRVMNFPDRIYRAIRHRPLLVVHLLDIRSERSTVRTTEPVVAWGISFPTTNHPEERVEYVVNTTWLRENFRRDLEDDDDVEEGFDDADDA